MKVVSYNIRFGLGLDNQINLHRIADAVRDADIVSLQEIDRFWKRSAMADQPKQLESLLKGYYSAYCPAFDVDASEAAPGGEILNRRRQFGPMLLSKWPILSARSILLPQLPTHKVLGMATGALEAVIDTSTCVLRVYSIHLSSASSTERCQQIDALLDVHHMIERCGKVMTMDNLPEDPVEAATYERMNWHNDEAQLPLPQHTLFTGDFNFSDDSAEYTRFLGDEDPVNGRGVIQGSLVDSWTVAPVTSGAPLTWYPDPPDRPPVEPLRLDYCFVNTELADHIVSAYIDYGATGSDHKPYWVEFDI